MGTDVRYSGSTCVSVMTYGRHLFIANVGDSRAIIIKQDPADPKRKLIISFFNIISLFRMYCSNANEGPQAG